MCGYWAVVSMVASFYNGMSETSKTLVEHWNGKTWSQLPSPNLKLSYNGLSSIAAVSKNDIWAVGWATTGDTDGDALAMHWDGQAWSMVPVPSPYSHNGTHLRAVTALSTDDVWAVGVSSP